MCVPKPALSNCFSRSDNQWTERYENDDFSFGTTQIDRGVTYEKGLYVTILLYGIIIPSTDGITWTIRTSFTYPHLFGVTYIE